MLFAKGSKVRFIHTGDEGQVLERIDDYMIKVRLDDGDEIPAFIDDLERIDDQNSKKPVKAKVVKLPTVPEIKPDTPKIATQYNILKSMGIQLAFDPDEHEGSPSAYQIFLINDTSHNVIFTFSLFIKGTLKNKVNGKLDAMNISSLGELTFDSLNDQPKVEIEVWRTSTQGTGKRLFKSFKIKAQQFFKKVRTAPLLNKPVHHYKVFENLEPDAPKNEDLQSYTKRKAKDAPAASTPLQSISFLNPEEFAAFNPEVDLHIEKLTVLHDKMNKADIIRLQIKHYEVFLEKAIRIGVDRIFVIHGVGKGKLRDAIANRLAKHPRVKAFKNEFHPKYGYGATEVIIE